MRKDEDKRLVIPEDKFAEEASEGLGRLNRKEAEEDLLELRDRIGRRVRQPRMIWLPAAAAVVILLVASTVYIALFRERQVPGSGGASGTAGTGVSGLAMAEEQITDTALIAMAEPITIAETKSAAPVTTPNLGVAQSESTNDMAKAEVADVMIAEEINGIVAVQEAAEDEVVAEEVVVEAMPKMEKAVAPDKKERMATTKPIEDSAVATPNLGVIPSDRQASPVGGMDEFREWIDRNIRYPEEVTPRERQVVTVTFRVAADSTVYDLKAERTAGKHFTDEAFRLLREGPGWVPAVRNGKVSEEEVRVSIVFK